MHRTPNSGFFLSIASVAPVIRALAFKDIKMDSELYRKSIEYEKLTQSIYQFILQNEGLEGIDVEHNINLTGRSGVAHQIDVHWKFKQANINHIILIECKNYASALTLEKVRNFHSVINDIGNCKGIMVTKVGYQSGAKKYAEYYGIDLKVLRNPTEDDWKGRVKNILLNIIAKAPVSEQDRPISMTLFLSPETEEQKQIIDSLQNEGKLQIPNSPDMSFVDSKNIPITEEMQWWLPKQLDVLEKEPGGPYEQNIELKDSYVLINQDEPEEQLVKVLGVKVQYWVEEVDTSEIVLHGNEIVKTILKDFSTNEVEHIQHDK
jgi:hypothetical protein